MKKLVVFGGTFSPPGLHHLNIALKLTEIFDSVIVFPCGIRTGKISTSSVISDDRKIMASLTFSKFINLRLNLSDLDRNVFTPTWSIDDLYKRVYPDWQIWHHIGGDLIAGGKNQNSEIQKKWQKGKEIWDRLNWAIINHANCPIDHSDLPPKNMVIDIKPLAGRSSIIRERIAEGKDITSLVTPEVADYIIKHRLYK